MKKLIILGILLPLITFAKKVPEAIYGSDDRDYIENISSKKIQQLSQSVAALINKSRIEYTAQKAKIWGEDLSVTHYLCEEERFALDFATAKCTGFLVGEDLFVTAGHCIKNQSYCDDLAIVFEFKDSQLTPLEDEYVEMNSENIYECKEIIHREYDYESGNDFSIVRLKTKTYRTPLKFRTSEKIHLEDPVFTLGHPSGLAQVYTNGVVIKNEHPFHFSTNLDTFAGNSGGPVFNSRTYEVEGVLVRGEQDYMMDEDLDCDRPRICEENGADCMGEEVVRITNIEELVPGMKPTMPPENPDPIDPPTDDNDDDDEFTWDDFFGDPLED